MIHQCKERKRQPLSCAEGPSKRRKETLHTRVVVQEEQKENNRPEKPEWPPRTMGTRAMTQAKRCRVSEARRQQQESCQDSKLRMQEVGSQAESRNKSMGGKNAREEVARRSTCAKAPSGRAGQASTVRGCTATDAET